MPDLIGLIFDLSRFLYKYTHFLDLTRQRKDCVQKSGQNEFLELAMCDLNWEKIR